jgi:hypothetical protein
VQGLEFKLQYYPRERGRERERERERDWERTTTSAQLGDWTLEAY